MTYDNMVSFLRGMQVFTVWVASESPNMDSIGGSSKPPLDVRGSSTTALKVWNSFERMVSAVGTILCRPPRRI
eukprot:10359232-Lingulodinium_polyedra.AAC.1